jgi:hypothetical protein
LDKFLKFTVSFFFLDNTLVFFFGLIVSIILNYFHKDRYFFFEKQNLFLLFESVSMNDIFFTKIMFLTVKEKK